VLCMLYIVFYVFMCLSVILCFIVLPYKAKWEGLSILLNNLLSTNQPNKVTHNNRTMWSTVIKCTQKLVDRIAACVNITNTIYAYSRATCSNKH